MEVIIEIKRQENAKSSPYFQSIRLTPKKENLTVASLLREINASPDIRDMERACALHKLGVQLPTEKMRGLCHSCKRKAKACL